MNEDNNQATGSLPRAVRYGLQLPSAVSGKQIMARFDAYNGVNFPMDTPSQEIRFNISSDNFLLGSQAVLQFKIQNSESSTVLKLMNSANDVIEEMRIESNGQILEQLDGYNVYCSILDNYKSDSDGVNVASFEGKPKEVTANFTTADLLESESVLKNADAEPTQKTYSLRFRSGFLSGGAMKKAIPLMNTGGFQIVIRLASIADAFVVCNDQGLQRDADNHYLNTDENVTQVSIIQPRIYCPTFEITDPNFYNRYQTLLSSSGITWSGQTSRRYVNYLGAGEGPSILQLNDRSLSLRGFVSAIRRNAEGVTADFSQAMDGSDIRDASNIVNTLCYENTKVVQYVYRISGKQYPMSNIDYNQNKISQAFFENIKLFSDMKEPRTVLDETTFKASSEEPDDTANSSLYRTANPKGTLAVDLKKYCCNDQLSLTGLPTALSTLPSTVEIKCESDSTKSRVDTFSICDALYTLDAMGQFSSAF